MGATNTILVAGTVLDLDEETTIVPSFQANDLTQPQTLQADFSPEFSVPDTARNHAVLGRAAYDGHPGDLPYKKIPATLLAHGREIIPRAILYLKGYANGRYQLQLFAGNRRFADVLGEKTLQELDFSRFDHTRTLDLVAEHLTPAYQRAHGWGYELYDRGKGVNPAGVSYTELLPTISKKLIWQQILTEAGFTATELTEPLFAQALVPATTIATFTDDFVQARSLLAGMEYNRTLIDRTDLQKRDDEDFPIPYRDTTIDGPPFSVPSAGNFVAGSLTNGTLRPGKWVADQACYISVEARTVAEVYVADLGGKVSAKIDLLCNGVRFQEGAKQLTDSAQNSLQPTTSNSRFLVAEGDEITAVLRLKFENGIINKYGYRLFRGANYQNSNNGTTTNLGADYFKVTVLPEIPPTAPVRLSDYLPDMKCLDFFKGMVQLLGLTVQTDPYEDHLTLTTSAKVLDTSRAQDWTRKRDTPNTFSGTARSVTYQFGSYAQANWLQWLVDDSATLVYDGTVRKQGDTTSKGYGDGVLRVADEILGLESSLGTLPFAATENSTTSPDFLLIPTYKREGDALDPLNQTYSVQQPKPRLTLRGDQVKEVLVRGGEMPAALSAEASQAERDRYNAALAAYNDTRTITIALSYFSQTGSVELDLDRYVLPTYWRGLSAMLKEARFHKERYRLTVQDISQLDYSCPIWDGVLGQYFALSKITEFSPLRSTEVEVVRLHPALLGPPVALPVVEGKEFYSREFNLSSSASTEFY